MMPKDPTLASKTFSYICANGVIFKCSCCDFRNEVYYKMHNKTYNREVLLAEGVAEMIGYHATNIHPQLTMFQGYDCITFVEDNNLTV